MAGPDPLIELEKRLTALKVEFERYFMGLEKRWPARERDVLKRDIRRFEPPANSVIKFRYQNLQQRHITLDRYWERILRAIENGTYQRDVFKADFRASRTSESPTQSTRQTPEQTRRSTEKAKAVGDEAQAFLDRLGGGEKESAPVIKMRGRSKRGKTTES